MNQAAWTAVMSEVEATCTAHLRELFAQDPDRASRFTIDAAGWTLDYSKNRITPAAHEEAARARGSQRSQALD